MAERTKPPADLLLISGGGWAAFIDESQSDRYRDPDTYILAAAVIGPEAFAHVRSEMLDLRIGKGGKVHWRDEDAKRQMAIITAVSQLPLEHLVVIRSCEPHERGERRRALCLDRLCQELDQMEVRTMILESRGPTDDRRDLNALQGFRANKTVSRNLRMHHQPGPTEPMLWIPDAVCGAVVAARTGTQTYLSKIESNCTVREV